MDPIMCMFVANYDYYDSQNSEDYHRSMTTLPCVGRAALHNLFTSSCFPSTEPGILIPRVRRPNRAYWFKFLNPNGLACTPPGPFWY